MTLSPKKFRNFALMLKRYLLRLASVNFSQFHKNQSLTFGSSVLWVGLFTKDKKVAFQPIQIQPPNNLSTIHIFQQFSFHLSSTQAGYSKVLSWFMPLPVLPAKHVIFSSCDLYRHLLQIFYQIHIIDHDLNRFNRVRTSNFEELAEFVLYFS